MFCELQNGLASNSHVYELLLKIYVCWVNELERSSRVTLISNQMIRTLIDIYSSPASSKLCAGQDPLSSSSRSGDPWIVILDEWRSSVS